MLNKKYKKIDLTCREFNLTLGERTLIMGILNVTPDSFSDGGEFNSVSAALNHTIAMVKAGADIIDIGGESTRPGSELVNERDELDRVIPIIKELKRFINKPVSVDTYKANVARKALEAGANIINDVWGLQKEPEIANVIAEYDVPVVIMHNKTDTNYDQDIIKSMIQFFYVSLEIAKAAGIKMDKIILDPGIGFGKTVEQNVEVLRRLDELHVLGFPLLLGVSRKSVIGKSLNLPAHDRLEGTIALNTLGIQSGVEIIRVHDIKECLQASRMTDFIVRGKINE